MLLLFENLVMVLLPVVLSSYYSKDDKEYLVGDPKTDILAITCMWIVSVSFKVILYISYHFQLKCIIWFIGTHNSEMKQISNTYKLK